MGDYRLAITMPYLISEPFNRRSSTGDALQLTLKKQTARAVRATWQGPRSSPQDLRLALDQKNSKEMGTLVMRPQGNEFCQKQTGELRSRSFPSQADGDTLSSAL